MNELPPDRGVSPVARKQRFSGKMRNVAIGGGAIAVVVLVVMGVNSAIHDPGIERKRDEGDDKTIRQVVAAPARPAIVPAVVQAPPPMPPPPPPMPPMVVTAPPPVVAQVPPNYVVMPASGSGEAYFDAAAPVAKKDQAPGGGEDAKKEAAATTQVAFKPSTIAGAKAGPAIRLTYTMMPQAIPCALDVAMDSTLAGPIFCHTTQDVLSPDHVLLMPAGTQVVGSYKSDVRTGQSRLFAFAGSAITKEGIPVPLDSTMADGMGRAGISGEVDSHFGARFGAAIGLSAVQMAAGIAQAGLSKGGNQYLNFNSGGGVGDLSTEILRRQADIPPTIYVAPGQVVSLMVDHPISFEDALRVRTRE